MATYGITVTQVAEYMAMITSSRFDKVTDLNQRRFYKRFCAAQDFEELIGADISTNMYNSIEAIDYNEWKNEIHEVQRSSTPLLYSHAPEILVGPFERERAALFMLMGNRIIESAESYEVSLDDTVTSTAETTDYSDWIVGFEEVQRSSTPLFGTQKSHTLLLPCEMQDAALFMLMGHRIFEAQESYEKSLDNTVTSTAEPTDYCEWKMRFEEVQRSSTLMFKPQESDTLLLPCEMEDAALFMLMGHRISESEY